MASWTTFFNREMTRDLIILPCHPIPPLSGEHSGQVPANEKLVNRVPRHKLLCKGPFGPPPVGFFFCPLSGRPGVGAQVTCQFLVCVKLTTTILWA